MATRSLLSKLARVSISSSASFQSRRVVDVNPALTSLSARKQFFSTDDKKPKGRKGVKVVFDEEFIEEDIVPSEVADAAVATVEDTWDDPFGLNYEDGKGGIGPEKELPPIYERDATTGRLTGVIKKELTEEEKRILKADPIDQEKWLLKSLEKHWQASGTDEIGIPVELNKLGERIRQTSLGLNVLGRSPRSTIDTPHSDAELSSSETFSKPLSGSEFKAFSKFMKKEFKLDIDEDHIPTASSGPQKKKGDDLDPDEQELALKWLAARAQRQMDDFLDDNPYSDLMPGDLSPSRLVNRKRAKQIPVKVLHHNNIPLLQRFLNPTGQLKHRIQTRLGARDQRRVAKLVKRARSLGLLPYVGQHKVETHGWIHEKDLAEDREWEKELKRRGLIIEKKTEPRSEI